MGFSGGTEVKHTQSNAGDARWVWSLGIHKTSKQNERQCSMLRKISRPRTKWNHSNCAICSGQLFAVQSLGHVQLFVTPSLQHARLSCPPPSPRACSNSCPSSRSCYLTISSPDTSFSFCLHSFPASVSFPMSQLFSSGDQSFGASASASVLPMNIQGWFPLGCTRLTSLLSQRTLKSLLQHHSSKATMSSWECNNWLLIYTELA